SATEGRRSVGITSDRIPPSCHTCQVNAGRILWVAGAYFAGISSTYAIVRLKGSSVVAAAADRSRSEADAHILIRDHIGFGWMVLAATIDVTKAGLYPLAARRFGGLPDSWVALCGFILVLGYAFPLFARTMAGRGLGAAAGVMLALVPVPIDRKSTRLNSSHLVIS